MCVWGKVTAKCVKGQSYNADHLTLINVCTISEQPVRRLVWELNSEK